MGPAPEGALNVAAWKMIRELVGADPALTEAAWESLQNVAGYLQAGEKIAELMDFRIVELKCSLHRCHSERSEESQYPEILIAIGMLRCAQHDKGNSKIRQFGICQFGNHAISLEQPFHFLLINHRHT